MNDTQDLELVDLGDVKEVTLGPIAPNVGEDHPTLVFRDQCGWPEACRRRRRAWVCMNFA